MAKNTRYWIIKNQCNRYFNVVNGKTPFTMLYFKDAVWVKDKNRACKIYDSHRVAHLLVTIPRYSPNYTLEAIEIYV